MGVDTPTANIIARACHRLEDGTVAFGGDCVSIREIDELIDEMIQDLEDARQLAKERYDV